MTIYTGLIKYHRDPGGNACKDTVSDKAACTDEIDGTTYCRRSIKLNFLCNNEVSEIPQFEEVEEARGCEYEVCLKSQSNLNSYHRSCPRPRPRRSPCRT